MPVNAEQLLHDAKRDLRARQIAYSDSQRAGWPEGLDAALERLHEAEIARDHFGARGSSGDMIYVSRLPNGATSTMRVLARWPEGVPYFLSEKPVYLAIDKGGWPHRIFIEQHEPSVLDVFVDGLPFEEMARISNLIHELEKR